MSEQPHHWIIECVNKHPLLLTKDKHKNYELLMAKMCIPLKNFSGKLENRQTFKCSKCQENYIRSRKIKTKTWKKYKEEFKI